MQIFPLKIRRHTAKSAGSKYDAAMLNHVFEQIEIRVNATMAKQPLGSCRVFDGEELNDEYGIFVEDFRAALDRLGEKGRHLIVFKGNTRALSEKQVLQAVMAEARRRVFGKVAPVS